MYVFYLPGIFAFFTFEPFFELAYYLLNARLS